MQTSQATNIPRKIVLTTLNSSYAHTSFGLRYIFANMGPLKSETEILEFTIAAHARHIAETLLSRRPIIIGFGIYIWNAEETLKVVSLIKKISPDTIIVLGGPEISYETETQSVFAWADYVIRGEADYLFPELCQKILANYLPTQKIISGALPPVDQIQLPYELYSDEDLKNRMIYVEASRGCPFKCEYCLSSLDKAVRNFPIDQFLAEMQKLLDRGLRQFKFVDRTFNLSPTLSTKILQFFLDRIDLGLFVHFEMIPDRLPDEIKNLIRQFPPGSLQFEVGIQTFDPQVQKNVSRRNDFTKVEDNFRFLKKHTGVHTHADLIVGLPGETLETFAEGFQRLLDYGPDEIQVGILKRLKGTPIIRHEKGFEMVYSEHQPFEILSTSTMSFSTIQDMQRFAKFWDLIGNSGNFYSFVVELKRRADGKFFSLFYDFSQTAGKKVAHLHGLSQEKVTELCFDYIVENLGVPKNEAAKILISDYCFSNKRRDLPKFLKDFKDLYETLKQNYLLRNKSEVLASLPERQASHQRAKSSLEETPSQPI